MSSDGKALGAICLIAVILTAISFWYNRNNGRGGGGSGRPPGGNWWK